MTVQADPLRARGSDVAALGDALRRGGSALESVPHQIKQVLIDESWRHFVTRLGKEVHHERFPDFATTAPLAGIGATYGLLENLCRDDDEALDMLNKAWGRKRRSDRAEIAAKDNNIINSADHAATRGTSKEYALRKLRKDAPELHTEVLAGRLSAHAAMVRAGYRPATFTVRADSPQSVAAVLRRRLPADQLAELARLLAEG